MMLNRYLKEINILTGLIVVIFFIYFMFFYGKPETSGYNTYYVQVSNVVGIKLNQSITIGGYPVGYVNKIFLDKNYNSIVKIRVKGSFKIPEDSQVLVNSTSLFSSNKMVSIVNGLYDDYLENGDTIYNSNVGLDLNRVLDLVSYYFKENLK